jgi:pyruvate/2-oxoglutarate dehydrogenase complex dihydrolipoamide dehydrogenase (E3) component
VTGVALFTHVANYQGRVVADNIVGRDRAASYHGIPRVVFADPEIAAAGLTTAQARGRGIDIAAAEVSLADAVSRPWTYERDPRGRLGLLADRHRRVLAGAWAVGIPAAATGLVYPVWAMIAMAASVTAIFFNSIDARPRPALPGHHQRRPHTPQPEATCAPRAGATVKRAAAAAGLAGPPETWPAPPP